MATIQGALSAQNIKAIPAFASPYTRGNTAPRFSNVDILKIRQPIVTTWVLDYGFTNIGPYKELIHQIEVTFQGKKYDYAILLVLDNEDAVYGGRESFGYPKVMGEIDFDVGKRTGVTSFVTATVSRPPGNPIIEYLFKPSNFIGTGPIPPPENEGLNLRVIPNIIPGAKPNIRQFIPITFKADVGERWEGIGSLKFPSTSEFDPLHKTPVVEYLGSELLRNCQASFGEFPTEAFDF
ncbi:hypothetical protein AA0119_g1311 [Alternaria tenuissima]|uniref:Decarboxylase DEC1 n=1 Tax=Alternaria tenuissima TaxID=119927 RepID=A0ABY0GN02_9PLEO|nr:hypothetical protein AA0119_g1311 [Alternaria tenuissima]RYO22286.1 hypothetical protein AA0121_g2408 [Alternaria tenuissima]RYO66819.1 hypothetical protein AA0116_g2666 [Alternaria tenuissima]